MAAADPARHALAPRAAVAVALGAVAVTLGPVAWRPDWLADARLDRLFGGLVAGAVLAAAFPRGRGWVALAIAVAAAGLEAAQALMPGRDASAADAAIKIAGGLAGIAAVRLATGRRRFAPGRAIVAAATVAAALAAAMWWTLSPAAAVRAALAAASRGCPPPEARPAIDIWARRAASFAATVHGDAGRAGCVVTFRRDALAWRLVAVYVRPAATAAPRR